jgi:hypothetical protein
MSYNKILQDTQTNYLKHHSQAEDTLKEYKEDFLSMNSAALKSISQHAENIIKSMGDENVKNNLTESWLQGKIAVTEDYMKTIHDFVMFASSNDDKTLAGCGCGGGKKKVVQPAKKEGHVQPAKKD